MRPAALVIAITLVASDARAQAPAGAPQDHVVSVPTADPAMVEAKRKARATLSAFFEAREYPKPGTDTYSIKIGLGDEGAGMEYFWVYPFTLVGDKVSATLGEDAVLLPHLHKGDTVEVPVTRVIDWMYYDHGVIRGAFTACAMLAHDSAEERAAFLSKNRLTCDDK